ncbi:uncharacterized protein G2W53_025272 [Senna tora]|uniref:Uncharacterized protein n=1 Tax=Senna tora TaxID=362788 RepID=A0A834WEL5_9FABA|nr:uncharacterized protein G2W53_025272 [Senna tora]
MGLLIGDFIVEVIGAGIGEW